MLTNKDEGIVSFLHIYLDTHRKQNVPTKLQISIYLYSVSHNILLRLAIFRMCIKYDIKCTQRLDRNDRNEIPPTDHRYQI